MNEGLVRRLKAPFRWLSGPLRVLPDFVIPGTQKGGTTSLYNYLIQHPAVLPASIKEPRFFDCKYRYGVTWYRGQFPTRGYCKRLAARLANRPQCGDATTHYLYHPLAAERIARTLPECKTIIMLRNPIERAYSHYQHEIRSGRETLSFEDAIEKEPERLAGEEERIVNEPGYSSHAHRRFSYLSRGHYAEQLERWWAHIGRERTLVLKSEDFFEAPEEIYIEVLRFLGLPEWCPPSFRKFNAHPYSDITPRTRDRLAQYFEPYNRQLYSLLGSDFAWE